ncbi:MAG: 3-deoxy-manno-octulosonate cytidylyltransferase [Deltaproteobacteria bacterium]|nr:3-deoxy-manno-octulosonate cytidylyltransferase [Deltaproteobacteria bacterium]
MDAVGVIPSRFGATRFPGKPLTRIAGKPLIQHVVEGALKSKRLSQILVATDHPEIAKVAEAAGARAVMTDPDLPSGTDRTWAALLTAGLTKADVVVNIQGDEPLIEGGPLDSLVQAFDTRADLDMATLGREMDLSTADGIESLVAMTTAKIVVDENDQALYFSRLPIPFTRLSVSELQVLLTGERGEAIKQQSRKSVLKHVGIYAFRPRFLQKFCAAPPCGLEVFEGLEQLRALSLGARIHVVRTHHESWGVDTPGDVEKIERLLNRRS